MEQQYEKIEATERARSRSRSRSRSPTRQPSRFSYLPSAGLVGLLLQLLLSVQEYVEGLFSLDASIPTYQLSLHRDLWSLILELPSLFGQSANLFRLAVSTNSIHARLWGSHRNILTMFNRWLPFKKLHLFVNSSSHHSRGIRSSQR